MREFSSSVLIVGDHVPHDSQIQIDHIFRLKELSSSLEQVPIFHVVILPLLVAVSDEAEKYLHILIHQNPNLQLIILAPKNDHITEMQNFLNRHKVFHVLTEIQLPHFDDVILSAIEASKQMTQDSQLEKVINEKNDQLKSLYEELEVKVQRRQESLLESKNRAFEASSRYQILLNLTELIQKSESSLEIEEILTQILGPSMNIVQTKIVLAPQDSLYEQQLLAHKNQSLFKTSLTNEDEGKRLGSLFFRRDLEKQFKSSEKDFLQKTAEIVSLALDRLDKLEQTFERKNVWDATFNAISDPVMIVNKNYEIIQTNKAFEKKANQDARFLFGKKCFQMLFQRDEPCTHCVLGQSFRLDFSKKNQAIFDVYGERLPLITEEKESFVHQYHDMTEQLKIEKKIMETARLAELGTIGSSIAHELNNPLGGMLSYAQLIKLEMKPQDPLYEDIAELESGIKRCRDIIQNLLGFARDPSLEKKSILELKDVLIRAVKIIELQSRAIGIEIKMNGLEQKIQIEGYLSHLTQAVQNLLQRSIQSILDQMKLNKSFKGIIEILLSFGERK